MQNLCSIGPGISPDRQTADLLLNAVQKERCSDRRCILLVGRAVPKALLLQYHVTRDMFGLHESARMCSAAISQAMDILQLN